MSLWDSDSWQAVVFTKTAETALMHHRPSGKLNLFHFGISFRASVDGAACRAMATPNFFDGVGSFEGLHVKNVVASDESWRPLNRMCEGDFWVLLVNVGPERIVNICSNSVWDLHSQGGPKNHLRTI